MMLDADHVPPHYRPMVVRARKKLSKVRRDPGKYCKQLDITIILLSSCLILLLDLDLMSPIPI